MIFYIDADVVKKHPDFDTIYLDYIEAETKEGTQAIDYDLSDSGTDDGQFSSRLKGIQFGDPDRTYRDEIRYCNGMLEYFKKADQIILGFTGGIVDNPSVEILDGKNGLWEVPKEKIGLVCAME